MKSEVFSNSNNFKVDKAKLVLFAAQISLIFITVIVALFNLSLDKGNQNLWIIVLTSCLGYVLPNPKLKLIPQNIITTQQKITEEEIVE